MTETKRGYSPRRAGEVVGVKVWPSEAGEARPVWITVHEHAHTYEIAWHETEGGPVITDLRVHSDDGTPITRKSLQRVVPEKLARAAQQYDTVDQAAAGRELRSRLADAFADRDPAAMVDDAVAWLDESGASEIADDLRRAVAEAGPAELVASGHEGLEAFRWTDGVVDALIKHAPPGAKGATPQPRRGGRPKSITPEFLARVAEWALEGRAYDAAVYPYVANCAAAHLGHTVAEDTVKGWVRRAKDAGLLAPGDLRRPRKPNLARERRDR